MMQNGAHRPAAAGRAKPGQQAMACAAAEQRAWWRGEGGGAGAGAGIAAAEKSEQALGEECQGGAHCGGRLREVGTAT